MSEGNESPEKHGAHEAPPLAGMGAVEAAIKFIKDCNDRQYQIICHLRGLPMTRGGGHKDQEATKARHFDDERSYVRNDGAEFLFGRDWQRRRREVWDRDERACVKCGKLAPLDMVHIDHKISRGDGGDDRAENLQTLFPPDCHVGGGRMAEHP